MVTPKCVTAIREQNAKRSYEMEIGQVTQFGLDSRALTFPHPIGSIVPLRFSTPDRTNAIVCQRRLVPPPRPRPQRLAGPYHRPVARPVGCPGVRRGNTHPRGSRPVCRRLGLLLSLIHISEPTRRTPI